MTFDQKIRIQKQIKTGTGSFAKDEWVDIGNKSETDEPKYYFANWVNVHGAEVWQNESLQAIAAATITIRYVPNVTYSCRIVYKGTIYNIVSIDNIRQRNLFLEMKIKAAVMG